MKYLILTVLLITLSAYAFVNQFMQMPSYMMQQMMPPPPTSECGCVCAKP
jgi:hypothetical protein